MKETVHTKIALELVATLSPEELANFAKEFEKTFTNIKKVKPVLRKKFVIPDSTILAQQILREHRAKNNTSKQIDFA